MPAKQAMKKEIENAILTLNSHFAVDPNRTAIPYETPLIVRLRKILPPMYLI